jgi:signal transduction histidine kinase
LSTALDSEQLAARWEFAATLSSRLAHDLSNIFTGVNGFSELAQLQLAEDHPARPYVADVLKAGQRGIELSQRLHLLWTCATPQGGPTPVGPIVEQVLTRVAPRLPADLVVERNIPVDLPPVRIGGDPLHYALAQLVVNAGEAAGPRGRVHIDARKTSLTSADVGALFGAARPGPHVELRIVDSGPGIPEEILARILRVPMASSRTGSRGLGLPIAFRALHAHQAGFALTRNAERGTTARVCLPVA